MNEFFFSHWQRACASWERTGGKRKDRSIKESNGRETGIMTEGIDWSGWARANERKITRESLWLNNIIHYFDPTLRRNNFVQIMPELVKYKLRDDRKRRRGNDTSSETIGVYHWYRRPRCR